MRSALVNRKDLKSNILQARTKVKDFVRKLFKGGGKKKALSRLNDSDTVKPATEPNVDPTDVGPGSATKGTPSSIARSWQGNGKYPGQDTFKDITLKKGKIIYGGVPGQSEFYTTTSGVMRSGGSAEKLYQGLQVAQSDDQYFNPVTGLYRSCVGAYEVLEDAPAAFGRAIANPHHGDGGFPQIFVENYQSVLKLIYVIPLEP